MSIWIAVLPVLAALALILAVFGRRTLLSAYISTASDLDVPQQRTDVITTYPLY